MLTVFFAITTLICAINWLLRYINTAVLFWYLQEKRVPLPTDEEMRRGSEFVVRHLMQDVFGKKH